MASPPAPTPIQTRPNPTQAAGAQQGAGNSSKTGLVSSLNGQRSYGTVKQLSSSFKKSSISIVQHSLEEGDTLQGLALKHNVLVS